MLCSVHGYCEIEKESGQKQLGKYFIVKGKNEQGKQRNFYNPLEKFYVFNFHCWPYAQNFLPSEVWQTTV